MSPEKGSFAGVVVFTSLFFLLQQARTTTNEQFLSLSVGSLCDCVLPVHDGASPPANETLNPGADRDASCGNRVREEGVASNSHIQRARKGSCLKAQPA